MAKDSQEELSEKYKEINSDTENVIIPGFMIGKKKTPTVNIPRLTEMLVMNIKISLLLHQGRLLLETSKTGWAMEPNHMTAQTSQKTKPYQAHNPDI